ncbi:MAG: PaaI family thioesterase [Acidobacteriota bacterium]
MMKESSPQTPRERTATWSDPRRVADLARGRSGLDFLRGMLAGEIPRPPVGEVLAYDLAEVEEGRAVFEIVPAEHHYNPIGSVHGGVIATVLDSAMGCAVHTLLPAGVGYTTTDLTTTFVRGVRSGLGTLRCVGEVMHVGGRTASARATLVGEDGTLYAHGSCNCLVLRP